jgi:multidrug efflux pump subunit AcrA (membrane-fusion protein)
LASRIEQKRADLRAATRFLSDPDRTPDAPYARLREELAYLERLDAQSRIPAPISAVVVTPHLHEKLGTYLREGDPICTLETLDQLEAEIDVDETYAAQARPGQRVELKARALPFETFAGHVTRIAPAAAPGDLRSTVRVYCRIEDPSARLKPGMSGYARIFGDRRCAGRVLCGRLLRFVRTEFWW